MMTRVAEIRMRRFNVLIAFVVSSVVLVVGIIVFRPNLLTVIIANFIAIWFLLKPTFDRLDDAKALLPRAGR